MEVKNYHLFRLSISKLIQVQQESFKLMSDLANVSTQKHKTDKHICHIISIIIHEVYLGYYLVSSSSSSYAYLCCLLLLLLSLLKLMLLNFKKKLFVYGTMIVVYYH